MKGFIMSRTLVFATRRFEYFAKALIQSQPQRYTAGTLLNSTFPNGERRLEVEDFRSARGANVLLVGGTECDDFFDLQMYAGELAQVCSRLDILLPFFRYATQERKDPGKQGHIIIAKGIARALSSLPRAVNGNRVFLIDPHTEALAQYFDDTKIRAETISCSKFVKSLLEQKFQSRLDDIVVASVDDGRPTLLKEVAGELNCEMTLIHKERISGSETKVLNGVNLEAVAGRTVVMLDDMARTLGSAIGAATAYRQAGAKEVWLVATHPDFSSDAISTARNSGVLNGVITTDSYPSYQLADGQFAQVAPLAPFLSKVLAQEFSI